ncbi:DUF4233 domain-containing protein [Corynebacterium sp. zg254]|uniref:DUF4233 domain-containing protein n=1 Tax=Corynebacterium zhongnanshanii TaxID=2768834 RepID=A0ABQ6VF78_9CORY|nr:DUF4233 domain-containing protein [Corynebacterium zhongnanshanii]MCR5914576.1 DUF4233 domain-containing protein [Corynebacterium sp. zg254]
MKEHNKPEGPAQEPQGSAARPDDAQMGPLGPGHELENDPMKGVRGVMAGAHILEAIVILLVLTVITRVEPDVNATTVKVTYVSVLGVLMILAAFIQRAKWADPVNIGLQVLAVAGFFVHPSMGFVGLLFAATWWYIYHLRRNMKERMRRGLLPAQHV